MLSNHTRFPALSKSPIKTPLRHPRKSSCSQQISQRNPHPSRTGAIYDLTYQQTPAYSKLPSRIPFPIPDQPVQPQTLKLPSTYTENPPPWTPRQNNPRSPLRFWSPPSTAHTASPPNKKTKLSARLLAACGRQGFKPRGRRRAHLKLQVLALVFEALS